MLPSYAPFRMPADKDELKRLRREVTQLKQERDVLKNSVAFFARDRS